MKTKATRYQWFCEIGKMWSSHANSVVQSRWFDDREECRLSLEEYKCEIDDSDDIFVEDYGIVEIE